MKTGELHAIRYGIHCMATDACWWACIFFTAAWGCWSRTKLLTVQNKDESMVTCPTNDTTDCTLQYEECCATNLLMFQQALTYMNETCSRFCLLVIVTFLHFIFYMWCLPTRRGRRASDLGHRSVFCFFIIFSGPVMCQLLGNKSPTLSSCGCRLNSLLCVVAAWTACCASNLSCEHELKNINSSFPS